MVQYAGSYFVYLSHIHRLHTGPVPPKWRDSGVNGVAAPITPLATPRDGDKGILPMRDITLLDMLQSGVHFGHQQSRRHPKMNPYLYATRGGVSIINLEKTKVALTQAAGFVRDVVASGNVVLFVGTKRQARDIVMQAAQRAGMPYVVDRWIGGLFTNFQHVKQLISKLASLKEQRAAGQLTKYTKKEQLEFEREIQRLEKLVGGLGSLDRLPGAIMAVDVKQEKTSLREAKLMKVPVIAMCDSNVNPAGIEYCIPANDDATKSIAYIMEVMVEAVQAGREEGDRLLAARAKATAEALAAANEAADALPEVAIDDMIATE